MSRNIHPDTLAVLGDDNLHIFHLITFYFDVPFYLTEHQHDIKYTFNAGEETFISTGRLASVGDASETLALSNPTIGLALTGANQADISLALTEDFNDRRVVIRRGFFDESGNTTDANIKAHPFIIFDGRVDSYTISDDPSSGDSTVTWRISSHFSDWERVSGRKCTNTSAKLTYPDEEGFSYIYNQIGSRAWGRVST